MVDHALNLSNMNAGILIMVCASKIDDILAEHGCWNFDNGGLPHVLPLAVQLRFVCWTIRGDYSEPFLLFEFFCSC